MKVSGFTFIRNGVQNGYPFEQSIKSILPVVDEFICVVGTSSDETLERIKTIDDEKIIIVNTNWNENMVDRGFVYGQQKMIGQYHCTGDWAFYLEGDEVLHEAEIENIRASMERNIKDPEVEALYFDFYHFYGTPDQVGIAGYRQAPRIIRNNIRSVAPDGLYWLVLDANKTGRYPKAKSANAHIYHYGHCRKIKYVHSKLAQVSKYWGSSVPMFSGYGNIDLHELKDFRGVHPEILDTWLANHAEHSFQQVHGFKPSIRNYRNRLRFWLEERFDIEISKKHFRKLD